MTAYLKRIFLLFIPIFILAASICPYQNAYSASSGNAASHKSAGNDKTATAADPNAQSREKGVIKLNYYDYMDASSYIDLAVQSFNATYPDVRFVVNVSGEDAKLDEYIKKQNVEIMAGEGPDVLIYHTIMPVSFYKIMESRALADINEFMKADKSFKSADYCKAVFNSGMLNGKRYMIPLFFTPNLFITTDEILSKNDFKIDMKHWTIKDFDNKLTALRKRTFNGKRVYFSFLFDAYYYIMNESTIKLVDYEKRKAYFDTPEFMELLNLVKSLNDANISMEALIGNGLSTEKNS